MGCCGSNIISVKNEIENIKKNIINNNSLIKNNENNENLLLNKNNKNNYLSKISILDSIKNDSKENIEIDDYEKQKEEEKLVMNENIEEINNSKNKGNSSTNKNKEDNDIGPSVIYNVNSHENNEVININEPKEEEKLIVDEIKKEINDSKNKENSLMYTNNENNDCAVSVTYSLKYDSQVGNEIINIEKSKQEEILSFDENREEINNLKNNGLNKINKDDFPKCNESLNIKDLEKFFIEKSTNLNEIEKSFFVYNWIAQNISLDLTIKGQNKGEKNIENVIKSGKSSNFNFAKLYKHLGEKLNLKINFIEGYSKILDEIENIPKALCESFI